MLKLIRKMKRGGLCFDCSRRYVKANNPRMGKDLDANQPSNFRLYEDANNLYGCSMSKYLRHRDLKFKNKIELDTILKNPDDNETGYRLEVDLHFPVELHDKLKEFPPAPESLTPDTEWPTPYQREIGPTRR